ncbi:hypothetical protein SUGI_0485380 [Cryptomeria japonica]|uniref:zinc-finger homeodomain protein 2 n=1 Tax=Cryptomeria japonica TaxID=3369 RepID=UPI002408DD00|nr:zinc-finger homeodomain protein 2 [Cryptomeria japonica]XP_057853124.1 zinc-finger homeodomain protein 2 [Cryptomeria japonica]XP_059077356.1 zinc-finger homeodomain protein 2 [Cryptomeria japonica]GLJ25345.1 hypothetical protein SUGI_0485380 [Cryptomeria japonica]
MDQNNNKNVAVGALQVPGSNPVNPAAPPSRLQVYEFNEKDVKSERNCSGAENAVNRHKTVRYRECLKNHAASIGSHAVDGCGEFMAGGGEEEALKCQACGCHRNFHRREVDGAWSYGGLVRPFAAAPAMEGHVMLGEEGHVMFGDEGHVTEEGHVRMGMGMGHVIAGISKKRFRTKFSGEQKEKMCAFAERLGWRIQKQDEPAVAQFCSEVGVRRNVLKVWMHNNKNTMGKNRSQ